MSSETPNDGQEALEASASEKLEAGKPESHFFAYLCGGSVWLSVLVLAVLIMTVLWQSVGWLDWQFLTHGDSDDPEQAGIYLAILGSLWMILLTVLFTVPLGVGSAIYLEEIAPKNWLTKTIQVNLANLAGVPSVVYGLLGLTVFVRMFGVFRRDGLVTRLTGSTFEGFFWSDYYEEYMIPIPFGPVVIAAALTMTLLILPVVIISSQEALRAVPPSLRHASLALGATRWQTIRHQIVPAALPGIMTGVILSISRAIGETAPLIVIGAPLYTTFAPGGLDSVPDLFRQPQGLLKAPFDGFVAMPMQIYGWITEADPLLKNVAAAGIIVLLFFLLLLNGLAILIRSRSSKHARW